MPKKKSRTDLEDFEQFFREKGVQYSKNKHGSQAIFTWNIRRYILALLSVAGGCVRAHSVVIFWVVYDQPWADEVALLELFGAIP